MKTKIEISIDHFHNNKRGRPKEHEEDWTKVTVILMDRQIHWLDKIAADTRLKTKKHLSRAEIIRALVQFAENSNIDLLGIVGN